LRQARRSKGKGNCNEKIAAELFKLHKYAKEKQPLPFGNGCFQQVVGIDRLLLSFKRSGILFLDA